MNEDTLIYELRPPEGVSVSELAENFRLTELSFMRMVKYGKSVSGEHATKCLPKLEYLPLNMTVLELKKMIYE